MLDVEGGSSPKFAEVLLEATPQGDRLAVSSVVDVGEYAVSLPDPDHGAWTSWRAIDPPKTGWINRFLIGQRELEGNEQADVVRFKRFGSHVRAATPQEAWENFQEMRTQTFNVIQPVGTGGGGVLLIALESGILRNVSGSLKVRLTRLD